MNVVQEHLNQSLLKLIFRFEYYNTENAALWMHKAYFICDVMTMLAWLKTLVLKRV